MPPTHQGLLLLDFLSPEHLAPLPHPGGRADRIQGGLRGDNGTVIGQDTEGYPATRQEPSGSPNHPIFSTQCCRADAVPGSSRSSWGEGPRQPQSRAIRAVTAGAGCHEGLATAQGNEQSASWRGPYFLSRSPLSFTHGPHHLRPPLARPLVQGGRVPEPSSPASCLPPTSSRTGAESESRDVCYGGGKATAGLEGEGRGQEGSNTGGFQKLKWSKETESPWSLQKEQALPTT